MIKFNSVILAAGLVLAAPLATGGDPGGAKTKLSPREAIKQYGKALDRLADAVNEFGSIHVSPPLLAEPGDDFKFDFHQGASNYFQSAKTEIDRDAGFFEQVVQSFGLSGVVQVDPTLTAAGLAKLQDYAGAQARRSLKQGLIDDALERQLQADLAAADQLGDPVEKLKAIAAARQKYATNYTAAEAAPAFPTAGGDALPGTATGMAKRPTELLDSFVQPKLTGFQGLFGDKTKPSLSNRAALNRAAGDVATEAIFRLLGQPEKSEALTGRKIVIGVVEVTVNPGWRTQRGFAADVGLLVEYVDKPARAEVIQRMCRDSSLSLDIRRKIAHDANEELDEETLKALQVGGRKELAEGVERLKVPELPQRLLATNDTHSVPQVFAVSPFSDLETSDQALSVRRQDELSLSLSFALRYFGLAAQAEAFEKFVRSRQSDLRSRTAIAPITTYSQGGLVGFQVGPRLQTIGNPTASKQRAEEILGRQAFPALLIFGVDLKDLYPRIEIGANGQWCVVERSVRMTEVPSWRPLTKSGCIFAGQPGFHEDDKAKLSVDLLEAADKLQDVTDKKFGGLRNTLTYRSSILRAQTFGHATTLPPLSAEATVSLEPAPSPELPSVRKMLPDQVTLNATNPVVHLAILGEKLKLIDRAGIRERQGHATIEKVDLVGGALRLQVKVTQPGPLLFELPVDKDAAHLPASVTLTSLPLYVDKPAKSEEKTPEMAVILRAREARTADQNGLERVVELAPKASSDQLAAAREIHRVEATRGNSTNAPSAHVNVSIDAKETHQHP